MACVLIIPARLSSSTYPTSFPRVLLYLFLGAREGTRDKGSEKRLGEKPGNEVSILGNNVELKKKEIA